MKIKNHKTTCAIIKRRYTHIQSLDTVVRMNEDTTSSKTHDWYGTQNVPKHKRKEKVHEKTFR